MAFLSDDDVERVLVVVAHPDDIDFGTAGSVAVWTDRGIEVQYCLVTDGDAGGSDPTISRVEMAEIRRDEQTEAAKLVGVTDLHFLGFPDGRVEASLELRHAITRVIRQVRPQRVVGMSPVRNFDRIFASHPDHLATGEATMSAVYPDSRNPFAFPDLLDNGYEPWSVDEVLLTVHGTPDRFVDITDVFDRKLAALLCHESQHADPARMEPLLRDWGMANAVDGGLPAGRIAEAFRAIDTNPF
ncbi:MAG: PIG-L deacetylase family protein [Actinomycetota bacterium]